MLSKGPQRKTRVRTDLYTQKVKFCNFCCFLLKPHLTLILKRLRSRDSVFNFKASKKQKCIPFTRSTPACNVGEGEREFFCIFCIAFCIFFCIAFCISFLYCFLLAFFVLFFLHFFLWIVLFCIVFFHCFLCILLSSVKVREQFNGITAFLDMSAIYASDEKWQKAMRQTEFHVKTCLCEERRCIKKRLSRRCPGTLKVIKKHCHRHNGPEG